MHRLTLQGHKFNLQILDNTVRSEHNRVIEEEWNITYQILPPYVHWLNVNECAIRTFKDHFLAILAGINDTSPKYLWDILLKHSKITLNLL